MADNDKIECVLCGKKYPVNKGFGSSRGPLISGWRKVCDPCVTLWEVGKKRAKTVEGKLTTARVLLKMKTDGRAGDPEKVVEIKSADIAAAMGAVKLRGTSAAGRFDRADFNIGQDANHGWMDGGSEIVEVPEARAKAMKKIIETIFNALAAARVDGFNEGRNLLTGLATGSVQIDDFTDQTEQAGKGKRPRWGF